MNNRLHRLLQFVLRSFGFATLFTGCASSSNSGKSHAISDSVPAEIARVFIHRNWNMVGAVVPHRAVDKGDGITNSVTLLQKEVNLDERGNRDRGNNVISVTPGVSSNADKSDNKGRFIIPAKEIGTVGAGGTLIYERPPGVMKIEIFSPNGDQAFAPWVNVEGGKAYRVEYHYMKAKCEITDVQTGKPVPPIGTK